MAKQFVCPRCGGAVTVADHVAERKAVICPNCRMVIGGADAALPETPSLSDPSPSTSGANSESKSRFPVVPPKTSASAVGAFLLSLTAWFCGLTVLTGIPAILLGLIARGRIKRSAGRLKGRGWATAGIVISLLNLLLVGGIVAVGWPFIYHVGETAMRVQQVSVACRQYAGGHNDQFPDDLETLVREGYVSAEMIQSPASGRPFVYLGKGKTADNAAEILLYAPDDEAHGMVVSVRRDGMLEVQIRAQVESTLRDQGEKYLQPESSEN